MFLLKWFDYWIAVGFGYFAWMHRDASVRYYAGMIIGILGLALWAVARIQLGKSFSVTAQARALVTTGLYSRIRNPIYFFAGVAYLGFFISWGHWIPLLCFVAVYSMQLMRARNESKVLEAAFGDQYRRYREQTWF